jgi:hypothetical protein
VLVGRQADLITNQTAESVYNTCAFAFNSEVMRSNDPDFVKQGMSDKLTDLVDSGVMATKGVNASSVMTNETRNLFFADEEVKNEVHSFTFMNGDPRSAICKELAGKTFDVGDVKSMYYSPPLHHNCKSYLRANLRTSRGVDKLTVTTLNPTASAEKAITFSCDCGGHDL